MMVNIYCEVIIRLHRSIEISIKFSGLEEVVELGGYEILHCQSQQRSKQKKDLKVDQCGKGHTFSSTLLI